MRNDKLLSNKNSWATNEITFSVIIPVYNCEKFIIETLKSVFSQTVNNFEVIIVDDCSTDNTLRIIKDYVVDKQHFYVFQNDCNMGVAFSRNYAISLARGKYVCLLDGDDVWRENKLLIQSQVLQDQSLDGCYSSYAFIDEHSLRIGNPYVVQDQILTYDNMLKQNYIGCSTSIVKTEIIKKEQFDASVAHEDYAMWLKLLRSGCKLQGISNVLVDYRMVQVSRSHNKVKAALNRFRVYRKCEHLTLFKSIMLFVPYSISGIIKHLRL